MASAKIKVLVAASECAPLAKVGGLGDVIGSLPKALKKLGADIRVVIPKYRVIDNKRYALKLIKKSIKVQKCLVNVSQTFLPESKVVCYLLENNKHFGTGNIYFERSAFVESLKEIDRFLFFSQSVLAVFNNLDWQPDIIHCHDWHTAILPVLVKLNPQSKISNLKSVLTIHNLANQGKWKAEEVLDVLGLKGDETESLKIQDRDNNLNIFQQGILNAELLNTVSPTYSKEILTKEYGEGLEESLFTRKNDLFGILNGIDVSQFDPRIDPKIKANYSISDLGKKVENKIDLQGILKLRKDKKTPLFGFIGRLTTQKGIDLISAICPYLVNLGSQLIILGRGSQDYETELLGLAKKYPKNIIVQIKFDVALAQKIYAGSDFFLMPSRFEPCGLGQLIAQRYGTIPIARKTGGLADTIEDGKTGFLFLEYNAEAFQKTIQKALKTYRDEKGWKKIIEQSMKKDFSWEKSAKKYLTLYKTLLK